MIKISFLVAIIFIITLDSAISQDVFVNINSNINRIKKNAKNIHFSTFLNEDDLKEIEYRKKINETLFGDSILSVKDFEFCYNDSIVVPDSIVGQYKLIWDNPEGERNIYCDSNDYLSNNIYFNKYIHKWSVKKVDLNYFYNDTLELFPYFAIKLYYEEICYEFSIYCYRMNTYPVSIKVSTDFRHGDDILNEARAFYMPFVDIFYIEHKEYMSIHFRKRTLGVRINHFLKYKLGIGT